MVAFGSSLTRPARWPSARDLLELLDVMSGFDPRDATSLKMRCRRQRTGRVRRDFDAARSP